MDRLTKRDKKGRAYFDNAGVLIRGANGAFHQKKDMTAQYIHDRFVALDKAIDLLATYEDTGLTPEDMDTLRKREKGLAELLVNISCGCAVTYTRLRELAQAEKDGRISILPPNAPLTLEELLKMDGEPVWIEYIPSPGEETAGFWALVSADKEDGEVFLLNSLGGSSSYEEAWADIRAIYRRKPEGESR